MTTDPADRPHRPWNPHPYQRSSVFFLHQNTTLNPAGRGGSALLLDCGMGKTAIVLEWIKQMREFAMVNRVLVVAPMRPMYNVWPYEICEWTDFRSMSYSIIHGSPAIRKKRLASPVDIHLINREALPWLYKQVKRNLERDQPLPWQAIIIDESTSFKNWSAGRTQALHNLIPHIPYRVIMTGTPTPKNLTDMFPQIWLLDEGESLGHNVTEFRKEYCYQVGNRDENKHEVFEHKKAKFYEQVQHLCLRLDQNDYLSVPPVTTHFVDIQLPPGPMKQYLDMEEDLFIDLASGDRHSAVNAAAKYTKCRQISNGGLYTMDQHGQRHVNDIHEAKIEACLEVIDELQGKPVLIAYPYDHDAGRLARAIKGLNLIRGGMNHTQHTQLIDGWNAGTLDCPHMAVQPKALSFGVNLQHGPGRDIIWFGPTDCLDDFLQFNARIWRQGVSSPVRIHKLRCLDTIDEVMWEKLDAKEDVQSSLLDFLREYARRRGH